MADEKNPTQAKPKPSRAPNDGLGAAFFRLDEIEGSLKIHQDKIQDAIEQRENLEERMTAALNRLLSRVSELETDRERLQKITAGLENRIEKLEGIVRGGEAIDG